MRHFLKCVLIFVIGIGILLLAYIVSPREWLPATHYDVTPASVSGDYQYDTWHEHIAFQQRFSTDDGIIRYIDLGPINAPVIVLVHGTPTSSWMYRYVIDQLIQQGTYRVIAPDMLGYGNANKPKGKDIYTTKKQADRLVALLDELGIDQRTQVVHDMGGTRTRQLLRDHPGHIDRLLVLNTVGFATGFHPPAMMEKWPAMGYAFTKLITVDPLSRLIMTQTMKMMTNHPASFDKALIDGYLYPTMLGQRRVYGYFLSSLPTVMNELRINQATLAADPSLLPDTRIIRGVMDDILHVEQVQLFVDKWGLDTGAVTILETGHHLIPEDHPSVIVDILENWK